MEEIKSDCCGAAVYGASNMMKGKKRGYWSPITEYVATLLQMPQVLHPCGEGGKMKELSEEELLAQLEVWANCSPEWHDIDEQTYNQLVKMIEDTNAYDERIDKIVEHYERQNREGIEIIGDECDVSWLHKNLHAEALGTSEHKRIIRVVRQNQRIDSESSEVDEGKDETIVEVWLEKNWNEDWCHSDDYEEMVKWLRRFKKQLLSQKRVVTRDFIIKVYEASNRYKLDEVIEIVKKELEVEVK